MKNDMSAACDQPRSGRIIIPGDAILIQAEILRNEVLACIREIEASEKGKKFLASKYVNATELKHLVNIDDVYGIGHLVDLDVFYESLDQPKSGYFLLDFGRFLLIPEEQVADLLGDLVDESIRIDMELAKVKRWSLREVLEDEWFFKVFKKE